MSICRACSSPSESINLAGLCPACAASNNPFARPAGEGEKVTLEVPVFTPAHLSALLKLEALVRKYLDDHAKQPTPTLLTVDRVSQRFRKNVHQVIEFIDTKGGHNGN